MDAFYKNSCQVIATCLIVVLEMFDKPQTLKISAYPNDPYSFQFYLHWYLNMNIGRILLTKKNARSKFPIYNT